MTVYSQKTEQKSVPSNPGKLASDEIEINKKYDECHLILFNGATIKLTSTGSSDSTIIFYANSKEIKPDNYPINIGNTKDEIEKLGNLMGIQFKKKSNKFWVLKNILLKFQNGKLIELPGLTNDPSLFL